MNRSLRNGTAVAGVILALGLMFAVWSCAPVAASPYASFSVGAPKPVTVKGVELTNEMMVVARAADSLVSIVGWTTPNDGKGALDSTTVTLTNINSSGALLRMIIADAASTATFRQSVPIVDKTYSIVATVCTWRGKSTNNSACSTATAPFTYGVPGPLPVTGLTVTNTKVP